jgi:hypothetical protein
MSFRLFVYYCAIGGAWSGLVGWFLAILLAPAKGDNFDYFPQVMPDTVYGLLLGLAVAFGLSLLDALFNYGNQVGKIVVRVIVAIIVGAFGGLFGSFIGSSLYFFVKRQIVQPYELSPVISETAYVVGWIIVGFLMGFSISVFEILRSLMTKKDFTGALKKMRNCLIGGTTGGFLGGILSLSVISAADHYVQRIGLWTPIALGFIAIGACIGLLVGLAQVILKEAWIKVEAGFRPGREMILAKEKTTIGRAESSDIALFGDAGVEKMHANIVLDGGRYFLEDLQSSGGSFVNDQKVQGRAALKAGDLIKVGKSVLRFHERAKRKD